MFAHHVCAWPEKRHARVFLEHLVEALEPEVVHLELPVHQDRHAVRLRDFVDSLHVRRVALDAELLFGDEDARRASNTARSLASRPRHRERRSRRTETISRASRRTGGRLRSRAPAAWSPFATPWCVDGVFDVASGRQQDGRRHSHRSLVRDQHVVRTPAVADVLMDVYDRRPIAWTLGRAPCAVVPSRARLVAPRKARRVTRCFVHGRYSPP